MRSWCSSVMERLSSIQSTASEDRLAWLLPPVFLIAKQFCTMYPESPNLSICHGQNEMILCIHHCILRKHILCKIASLPNHLNKDLPYTLPSMLSKPTLRLFDSFHFIEIIFIWLFFPVLWRAFVYVYLRSQYKEILHYRLIFQRHLKYLSILKYRSIDRSIGWLVGWCAFLSCLYLFVLLRLIEHDSQVAKALWVLMFLFPLLAAAFSWAASKPLVLDRLWDQFFEVTRKIVCIHPIGVYCFFDFCCCGRCSSLASRFAKISRCCIAKVLVCSLMTAISPLYIEGNSHDNCSLKLPSQHVDVKKQRREPTANPPVDVNTCHMDFFVFLKMNSSKNKFFDKHSTSYT